MVIGQELPSLVPIFINPADVLTPPFPPKYNAPDVCANPNANAPAVSLTFSIKLFVILTLAISTEPAFLAILILPVDAAVPIFIQGFVVELVSIFIKVFF